MGYLPLFVLILPTFNFGKWPSSLRLNPDTLVAGSQGPSLNGEARGASAGDRGHTAGVMTPETASHAGGHEQKVLAGSGDSLLLYPNKSGFYNHLSVLQKRLSSNPSSLPSCLLISPPSRQLQNRRDRR